MMASESWKPVPSLGGRYFASTLGRIKGPMGRPLRLKTHVHGYKVFCVADGRSRSRNVSVARSVCEAFHGPAPVGAQVDHLDSQRDNDRPENLRWVSRAENLARRKPARGELSVHARLSEKDVRAIRAGGKSDAEWAELLGVGRRHICDIRNGVVWRHVDV